MTRMLTADLSEDTGPVAPSPGRRQGLLWAAFGTVLIGLGIAPTARVPIIGDDFQAMFESYGVAHGNPLKALSFGWHQGFQAGHFNPVGQAIGALHHFLVYWVSAGLGLPPQLYDVVVGAALIWLTVLAATTVLVNGLAHAGMTSRLDFWRAFALLGAVTAITLQLHPWSNDPASSYLLAGWGSAAIGFTLLGLALRATLPGRAVRADVVLVGAAGVFAVLYYEMLVGAIAGTAVVYGASLVGAARRKDRAATRQALLLSIAGVVIPAVIFVGTRLLAVPQDKSQYTGTAISLGGGAVRTWVVAMVGALPGGGWPYLMHSGGNVPFGKKVLLFTAVVGLAVLLLMAAWRRAPAVTGRWTRAGAVPVAAVLVTWAATTATHAVSPKYIQEIRLPGQVYLYYAVAVACVALLLSAALVVLGPRLAPGLRSAALLALGAYLALQVPLNLHLADVSAVAYSGNRDLSKAASDPQVPEQTRCDTLLAWTQRPWPQYYRASVVKYAQEDFQQAFGKPLCADPMRAAQLQFMIGN